MRNAASLGGFSSRSIVTTKPPTNTNRNTEFVGNNSQFWKRRFSSTTKTRRSSSFTNTIRILRGDITRWSFHGVPNTAVVNPSNPDMLGGGEVYKAIRRAAGPGLQEACLEVPMVAPEIRCPIGEARITPAFRLPVSHVIHTASPIAETTLDADNLLQNSYRSCLKVAKENNIQHIAFPALCSSRGFGFTSPDAAHIAISTVKEFRNDFKEVHFVIFKDIAYDCWLEMAKRLLLLDDVQSIHGHEEEFQSRDSSIDGVKRIAEVIERPDMLKIQEELEELHLDRDFFIKAATYLGRDPTEAHVFFGLRDEYRMDWLSMVLENF